VPDAKGFNEELRRQLFPEADNIGREFGSKLGRGLQESIRLYTEKIKEELRQGFTANVNADTTKAKDEIDAMRVEQEARPVKLRTKIDENSLRQFGAMLASRVRQGLGNVALGGLAGAGLFGAGAAGLAAAGPLAAATAGIAGFAAVAIPEITKVEAALKKAGPAGQKAWQQLTPQQREVGESIKAVKAAFADVQKTVAPAVDNIVSMAADLAKDFMPALAQMARIGAKVIGDFIRPLDKWISSKQFVQLGKEFGNFALQAGKLVGPWLVQLLKAFTQLFLQLLPAGMQVLKVLLPFITQLIVYLTPGIVIMANLAAATLKWLAANHLLLPVLALVLAAVVIMVGPTGIGGIIAAIALAGLAISFFAKNWRHIWMDIKNWAKDAWDFLTHGWGQLLIPGLTAIRWAVQFVRDHWKQAWNDIKGFTTTLWHFIGPLFKIGLDIIMGLVDALWWLWRKDFALIEAVGKAVWQAIVTFVQTFWNQAKPIVDAFGKAAVWVFKNVIEPAAKWLWDHVVSHIQDAMNQGRNLIRTFLNVVLTVFGAIIHGAANAFGWVPGLGGKLKDAAHQFDIFRDRVNKALGGVNGRHVTVDVGFKAFGQRGPASPGYPGGVGAASGGPIYGPGSWTSDSIPAWLSNNEFVMRASAHAKYGTEAMRAVNEGRAFIAFSEGGSIRRFSAGGGLNVQPMLPSMQQIQAGIVPVLKRLAQEFASTMGSIGIPSGHGAIGGGVQRWASLVLYVLRLLGQPAGDLGTVLSQMTTESGGNPFAINLWDSNAAAGDPSRGLMQVIGSTFAAYAGPFRGRGIFDPLANIYAGLNYAIHRYGSAWTSVLGHGHGYDDGGWMYPGEWGVNMLSKPEPVLSPGQWDAIYSAATKGSDGVQYHAHFDGMTAQVLQTGVRQAFRLMEIQHGTLQRSGRRA
jgi:hypothetical protein